MKQEPSREDYRMKWEPMHRHIFSGAHPLEGAFEDSSWSLALLPGALPLYRHDFESLQKIAMQFGDEQFVVVCGDNSFPDSAPLIASWDHDLFGRNLYDTVYKLIIAHSFGLSGEWGMVSVPEGFNILGGSGHFMDRFVEISGGKSILYDRFMGSVRDGDVSFGRWREALIPKLLELVGWGN